MDDVHLLVEFLAHQQFYSRDDDLVLSRDNNTRIKIPEARKVVDAFIEDLAEPLSYIYEGEYSRYLEKLEEKLPIEKQEILEDLERTKEVLGTNSISKEIATNVLVGGIRSCLHRRELQRCFGEVLESAKKYDKNKEMISTASLDTLCEKSDPDVALLHNLVLLRLLASTYSFKSLEERVQNMIELRKESLARKLV